ncbi:MAG: hypothetical protein KIT48_19510 [Pseudolabrys sp.]|nr:hypothetical protein [Pseudolabrys sp.]
MTTTEDRCDNASPAHPRAQTQECRDIMSASVHAFTPRAAAPAQGSHGEASLIELGRQFDKQLLIVRRLSEESERLDDISEAQMPSWPTAACVRPGDRVLLRGRFSSADFTTGRPYTYAEINRMTEWKVHLFIFRPAIGSPRSHKALPWPRAQRRLDEICAAHQQWRADCISVRENTGYAETYRALSAADDKLFTIIEGIASARALSPEGLAAKARAAAFLKERFDPVEDTDDEEIDDRLMRSLYRDAIAIGTPPSPAAPAARRAAGIA